MIRRGLYVGSLLAGLLMVAGCSSALPNLKSAIGLAVEEFTVELSIKKGGVVIKQYVCGYDAQKDIPVNCKEVNR